MSFAGGDLDDPSARHPRMGSGHRKDKANTDHSKPDQRHKGHSTDGYAASNPWYGQPRSSPVYGLAESLPHKVRGNQGRRYADRDKAEQHEPELDIEKGKTGRQEAAEPHTFFGLWLNKYHMDAGVDREDASSQEGITTSSAEKTGSETDASKTQSPRAASKDQTKAEEEEEDEKRKEDERQANYDRHRNPLARFRAKYPDFFAEYLPTTITILLALCGNITYRVNPEYGTYETLCWTHGLATMAGIYLADGVSGSHVNPMMSLTLAVYRGFPWHEFSVYLVAQSLVDPGLTEFTGKSFYTIPTEYISVVIAFWNEFLAIAV
ncbi:hypothetical protein H2201_005754 [Coniosporium apollinis]|uniref:Aquaporin n=1 Tax=Coniosporium apollinis TaxID=61459 RepID=A0ABQ9NPC1_9PEZI|nr:hypothetical protein H2201_005754 [Coniosporium apollinis]